MIYKDKAYQIVGCAMEVLHTLGHDLHEKPYENALAVEFELRGISGMRSSKLKWWWFDHE